MVKIETTARLQDATYWEFDSNDRYGQPKVKSPTDIKVRWLINRDQVVGVDETPINVNGTIVTDIDIVEGSLVREGTVEDLPSTVTSGLMEIVSFKKTPDLKNRNYRRVCTIRKYKSTLPTVV